MTVQGAASVSSSTPVVTTTETVAAVLPGIAEVVAGGGGYLIHGFVNVTPGTTAVSAQIKVRQGTTNAGTQVGNTDTHSGLVAGSPYSIPFAQLFEPQPGLVAMPPLNQFCVTVTFPAATANGSINDVTIWADSVSFAG